MSIIHEALKKVQSDRLQNKSVPPVIDRPTAEAAPASLLRPAQTATIGRTPTAALATNKRFPVEKFVWSALILILAGFTFFNLSELTSRITTIESSTASTPAPQIAAARPTPSPEPAPAAVGKRQKGEIILYGITIMDGKNFALLNEGIYEVGDEVENAIVTRITDQSVIISQKGKTKILKVKK